MPEQDPTGVILDTIVATWLWFAPSSNRNKADRAAPFREALIGKTLYLSAQSRAELLVLPLTRNLGDEKQARLIESIEARAYLPLTREVQKRYAEIKAWAKANCHPLFQKDHSADLWIAATAVEFVMPVASTDRSFEDVPDLSVINPT